MWRDAEKQKYQMWRYAIRQTVQVRICAEVRSIAEGVGAEVRRATEGSVAYLRSLDTKGLRIFAGFYWWSCRLFLKYVLAVFVYYCSIQGSELVSGCCVLRSYWFSICTRKLVDCRSIWCLIDIHGSSLKIYEMWSLKEKRRLKPSVGQHLHTSTSTSTRSKGVVAPFQESLENERRL